MRTALGALADLWADLAGLLAGLAARLPEPADPALLLVAATLLAGFAALRILSRRIDRRGAPVALLALLFGLGLFLWVWASDREGFGWLTVPGAFVEVAARLTR